MRFIFTSYASPPPYDRPETWLRRIKSYIGILESLSKNNTVIGIERINYQGEYMQNGVQYYFVKEGKKVVHFPWRTHRLIKKLQPDVVVINGLIFPLQVIQLRLKLGVKVKIILLHRSEKPYIGWKRYLQKLSDKCVNAYLFSSSELGNLWKSNINIREKVYEVIQASSVFSLEDKLTSKNSLKVQGYPFFLWVGRLDANKDPLTVVRAFACFLKFRPAARLYMIYQTDEKLNEILKIVSVNEKIAEGIALVGKVPHEELQNWYNSADFIISSSHYEGSGVAVCEAMSCGCVPILTNIMSFRRMTGPAKCGLLYEPGNDKDLLAALLKTGEMNIEMERAKVLQQYNDELSFDAIAKKIEKVVICL